MSTLHETDELGRSPRARKRRGCGCMALLLSLALLVGVLAILDEVARRAANHRAADELQHQLGSSQAVDVHFGGWPFSWALVTGRVPSMHVTAPSLELKQTASNATITNVDITGRGVHDVRHPSQAVADHLSVSGSLSWAELSQHARATLTSAGGSKVRFTRTVSVLGSDQQVVVTATPSINPSTHKVVLTDVQGSLAGITVPSSLLDSAAQAMAQQINLPTRGNLQYTGLVASDQGVRVTMQGDNVLLDSLR